ncbi:MAG: ribosome recycling factor [Candidatus Wildermuthbacteria bacterium RIFCSPHIGHO2_12_FULL_45_9]|uniref:Ribosome recycling factor n=1 Tax=Candidatus Wildermuthbacteria bacterium RIFCSPHIGHO2_02_FULL_45_25 TaxID=1802450 RepID=A0A1G2QY37_9BACT|nr:MAG: ribosome recycling factor [Candidatus Wildermuthbacteria bacterium RIFCSPHIGHO2_01_FULL_45_20]OHA65268.1 MAG: ribosome recycling factor [Candidatus Wildermuthbacteria bacterium RIFCSPHIGHO2_02_FULL_45_25]OHA71457.1 MAG: ribosome recycling factor [Candidatus Wildermuthbacteria bacterium RIFCSPHIGHO2_12_FULL_45_9]
MYQNIITQSKPELEKAMEFFTKEIAKIRTGLASPSLVEDVMVDVYGQKMPIKHIAAISCPERRQILVQPWDKGIIGAVEKALMQSSFGSSPITDREGVRLHLPMLTQEFREKLSKVIAEKEEETREVIRKIRDEAWGQIQEKARLGEIREDDKFKGKEELQKIVDEYNKKIEEAIARKLQDIKAE